MLAAHHRLERIPQMAADQPRRLGDDWTIAHAAFRHSLLMGCPNLVAMLPEIQEYCPSMRDISRGCGYDDGMSIAGLLRTRGHVRG